MKLTYLEAGLGEIDADDRFFQLLPGMADALLMRSVARLGIVEPIHLQLRVGEESPAPRYRPVTGFRRLQAAAAAGLTRIPAMLLPRNWDDLQAYRWLVEQRGALRPFSPLEASHAIAALSGPLSLSREEILRTWFPLMGLAPNPKLFSLYAPLRLLEPELQSALAADELAMETAGAMASAEPAERLAFWQLSRTLRLGKNRQREFWLLLSDIERIDKASLPQLLAQPEWRSLLEEQNLTPSQKTDRFKNLLMTRRYPAYSATLARLESLLRSAKLPPELHLRPTPWFAGEEYTVDFSFSTPAEFTARLETLQEMQARGLIDQLTELT